MARQPQQSTLETRLAELERRMRVQETANRLRSSSVAEGGLRFYGGGSATFEDGGGVDIRDGGTMRVDGDAYVGGTMRSVDFDGDLDAGNVGTTGWAFNRARAAIGELLLRPGSIGNEALANPVIPEVRMANATGFSLNTTLTEKVGLDVTVPPGCTRLLTKADSFIYAYNQNTTGGSNGAGGDALYCRTDVHDAWSAWMPQGVSGNNGYATQTSSLATLHEGLTPGQTLRLATLGASAYQPLSARPENRAYISAMLIWLR